MADTPPEIPILLLGDPQCGKSTLLSRLSLGSSNHNTNNPLPPLKNLAQPLTLTTHLFNRPYTLKFSDTSSPTHWSLLKPDIIILGYDISSRVSLENVKHVWRKEVYRIFTQERDIPVLLLGLKRDLRSEKYPNAIIYPQEGHKIAQECRCDRYMECSAVTGELVFEVLEDICRTAALTTKGEEGGGGLSSGGCWVM